MLNIIKDLAISKEAVPRTVGLEFKSPKSYSLFNNFYYRHLRFLCGCGDFCGDLGRLFADSHVNGKDTDRCDIVYTAARPMRNRVPPLRA